MDETRNKTSLRRPVMQYSAPQEEKKERIKLWMAGCLIVFAFCIDCLEMLLEWLGVGLFGLSTLISICATFIFWVWFKILKVDFTGKPKNFTKFGITSVLELIPGLDAIFGFIWTVGIIMLVVSTRTEDKSGK